jgi:putative nucleotidyltransferase with HDIG domain
LDERTTVSLIRYLPQVVCATLLVAVCPVAAAWGLRRLGVIDSAIVTAAISMLLALAASWVGRRVWSGRPASRDLLFSELLLWGWLRRVWVERRLSRTLRLLEHDRAGADVGAAQRHQLLAQLAMALEARDPYTHGHSRRVARHSATIARRMGLSREEVADVRAAAVLHDVGKMDTPNAVLHKSERLTDAEFAVIQEHPGHGAAMVAKIGNDALTAMVRHHHERLDGSGYPDGLVGDAIPLGARIIAVADTFDAITSTRPYRPPRTHQAAISILEEQAGPRLDPDAVRAFQSHYAGRRSLAAWVGLTNVPERVVAWLGGGAANVASGSAVRVVAASALSGAAAATAVVNLHMAPAGVHRSAHPAPIAVTGSPAAWPAGVRPSPASSFAATTLSHVGLQSATSTNALSLVNKQSVSGALAPAQVIGAVGSVASTPSGSASRGVTVPAGSSTRGPGGLGGSGTGAGRIPGVVGGGDGSGSAAGSPTTQPPVGGDPTQSGSAGGDGTQTSGADGRGSGPGGGAQTTPPGDTQTTPPSDTQTTPPSDTQTTPPGDTQTPPPSDTQSTPPDSTQTSPSSGQASTGTDQTTGTV